MQRRKVNGEKKKKKKSRLEEKIIPDSTEVGNTKP